MTVERQQSLRRVFERRAADWRTGLCSSGDIAFEHLDARGTSDGEVDRMVREHAGNLFPLDGSALVRFLLVDRGTDQHCLLTNWHQIVHDHNRESANILTSDILEHYVSLGEHRAPQLAHLPVRQVDYAKWSRDWYVEGPGRLEVDARRAQLAGVAPVALADHPRDAPIGPETVAASFLLDEAEGQRLESMCRSQSITRFMAALAVIGVLVRRWSGQDDLVTMTLRNFRPRPPPLAHLTGRYTGPTVARVSTTGRSSWAELLRASRTSALDATTSPGPIPLSLVYGTESPPDHPLGHLVLNDMGKIGAGATTQQAGDLTYRASQVPLAFGARAPLFFGVFTPNASDARVAFSIVGSADRYEKKTIERLAKDFRQILTTIEPDVSPFGP